MRGSTFVRILGVLAIAIVAGGLIGWWASRGVHPAVPVAPEPPASQQPAPVAVTPVESAPVPKPVTNDHVAIAPAVASNTNAFDPALWDEKVDEILGDGDDDTDHKARQLLDIMDKVGVEAQTEIAGHVINLIDDKDFTERAAKYLTNAEVPEAVSRVFMDDLYNRDEEVKLPLLLIVAKNDKHPLKDEARDLLQLYIEEDYGTNWNQWEDATKKYLKEHAAEEAPEVANP